MSFTNLYYKRTAGTPKACYICYKPTTTVLATVNTVDFLYTCPGHLKDPGFASPFAEPTTGTPKPTLTAEEIAKVKAEWEEKQKKKAEKEKEQKEKDEADKKKEGGKNEEKGKDKAAGASTSMPTSPSPSSGSGTSSPATHERYTLHRDFFSMRLNEHKKRRQAAQAKDLAPRLPYAPSGGL